VTQELIVWVAIAVAFAVAELATMAFVGLYFAIGAIAAAVLAGFEFDIAWQVLAFVATSIVLLALTRPFLQHRLQSEPVPMNVDRMTGKRGIVTIPIDNDANTGQIRVGTEYWTARLEDGSPSDPLPVEARVEVVRVSGVTAYVVPLT
jgi:membrane protein implicated in regulation of membrane protease activity